jgi:LEA14-like dessication related protein
MNDYSDSQYLLLEREKMNTKLSLISVSLLCLALAGCETLQNFSMAKPTARITGVQFADASLSSAQLVFDVEVDNPYTIALPLTNLDYTLSSGDSSLLAGNAKLQTSIPAKGSQAVSLPVTVNYLEMFKSLKGITPGTTIPYKAGLGLSVETPGLGPLTLPLKKEGRLALPKVSGTDVLNVLDALRK